MPAPGRCGSANLVRWPPHPRNAPSTCAFWPAVALPPRWWARWCAAKPPSLGTRPKTTRSSLGRWRPFGPEHPQAQILLGAPGNVTRLGPPAHEVVRTHGADDGAARVLGQHQAAERLRRPAAVQPHRRAVGNAGAVHGDRAPRRQRHALGAAWAQLLVHAF